MQIPPVGPIGKPPLASAPRAEPVRVEPVPPTAAETAAKAAAQANEPKGEPASAHAAATASHAFVDSADVAAQYMVAEDTKHILVRIYNRRTGETIRMIPPTLMVGTILKSLGVKSVSRLDRLV